MLKLIIGNKKYSSWSLRPWLALTHAGIQFEEQVIALDQPDTDANIRKYSPSGKVPCLIDGAVTVWDSLAIVEYVNEKHPEKQLWPKDASARAVARSVSAEMHSGFSALRNEHPMKIIESLPTPQRSPETVKDVQRIQQLWRECRQKFGAGGPFLFGAFSIADAFYAPVVSRFRTYGVPMEGAVKEYADAIWALPAMQKWVGGAQAETLRVPRNE